MNSIVSYMKITQIIAQRSNCLGAQVGAIIVKDDRILSTGYNGTPKGYPNCCDVWDHQITPEHYEWSKKYEIHAEQNAIIWAARKGISIEGSDMYTTMRPCAQCTKLIIGSGIKNIYYNEDYSKEYHLNNEMEEFILNNGINIIKVDV
jgi:dCMP deaminase